MNGRRQNEEKRQLRRSQIRDAARRVFSEKGYEAATIRDIEDATSLTRGAIYYHFRGKEEIYVSVLSAGLRLLRTEFEWVTQDRNADPRELMSRLLATYCEFYRSNEDIFRIAQHFFFGGARQTGLAPAVSSEVGPLASECLQLMTDVISVGMKRGVFVNRDAFFEVLLIWSLATNMVRLTEENPRAAFLHLSWTDMRSRLEESVLERLCGDLGRAGESSA